MISGKQNENKKSSTDNFFTIAQPFETTMMMIMPDFKKEQTKFQPKIEDSVVIFSDRKKYRNDLIERQNQQQQLLQQGTTAVIELLSDDDEKDSVDSSSTNPQRCSRENNSNQDNNSSRRTEPQLIGKYKFVPPK